MYVRSEAMQPVSNRQLRHYTSFSDLDENENPCVLYLVCEEKELYLL